MSTITDITKYLQSGETLLYAALVGSRAYGTDTDESDTDIRGIYVAHPRQLFTANSNYAKTIAPKDGDTVLYEVEHFCHLGLKGNPAILELLWSPATIYADVPSNEIQDLRQAFLSRNLYHTYKGYMHSALAEFERSCVEGQPKWKKAMHVIRTLFSGTYALRYRLILVDFHARGADLNVLRAIRAGEYSVEQFYALREEAEREFIAARNDTTLPEYPNVQLVNDWLYNIRIRSIYQANKENNNE